MLGRPAASPPPPAAGGCAIVMVMDDLTHKNMRLFAFALAVFVYLVGPRAFALPQSTFYYFIMFEWSHGRLVERRVLTFGT